ncbi:unnamed protein product [Tetraodon nigroviridis]|uniref:(spotted green pufferfish) hypothetical protein n=1 Tax=Tetraodon nigroviridis TaxID=99883 RepID=Q4S8Y2_TETNG|nr:unnamed protein product [Tetraodon nigroviridis]
MAANDWDPKSFFFVVDLARTNRRRHLAPLQDHVFNDPAVGVDVDTFVLVTQKHFHAIGAGKEHYCMWRHLALDLFETTNSGEQLKSKPAVFSTGFYSLFFFNIPGLLFWADLCFSEMKNFIIKSYKNPAYMNWNINVIVVSRIDIDGMETSTGTVDDLQPLTLLHCKVNQDRPVWQVCKRLVQGERTINSRAHLGSGINASS